MQVEWLKEKLRFAWSEMVIPYLWISLAASVDRLYAANFPPMYSKLEAALKHWDKLGLSWLGRVNSVKMTLLPRIFYLFRSLPIPIRKDQLWNFQSRLIRFIWGTRGHRVAKTLYRTRDKGGVGLPILLWYYQAAQLTQLSIIYSK